MPATGSLPTSRSASTATAPTPPGARGFHVIAPTDRRPWTHDIYRSSRRLALVTRAALAKKDVQVANYIAGGDGLDFRSDLGDPQPLGRADRDGRARQHAQPRRRHRDDDRGRARDVRTRAGARGAPSGPSWARRRLRPPGEVLHRPQHRDHPGHLVGATSPAPPRRASTVKKDSAVRNSSSKRSKACGTDWQIGTPSLRSRKLLRMIEVWRAARSAGESVTPKPKPTPGSMASADTPSAPGALDPPARTTSASPGRDPRRAAAVEVPGVRTLHVAEHDGRPELGGQLEHRVVVGRPGQVDHAAPRPRAPHARPRRRSSRSTPGSRRRRAPRPRGRAGGSAPRARPAAAVPLVDSAPTSTMSAPWAACTLPLRIAAGIEGATLSRYVESRDRFTTPMTAGRASVSRTVPRTSNGATVSAHVLRMGSRQAGQRLERDHAALRAQVAGHQEAVGGRAPAPARSRPPSRAPGCAGSGRSRRTWGRRVMSASSSIPAATKSWSSVGPPSQTIRRQPALLQGVEDGTGVHGVARAGRRPRRSRGTRASPAGVGVGAA